MKRIPTTLAAMVAAAAVAAAITIPAVAQSGGDQQDPALAKVTSCLTAHGVDVPAGLDGAGLKQWVGQHQDDATIRAALDACGSGGRDSGFARLYSCLKAHGVDVANSPAAVKGKVLELSQTDAGKATLEACNIHLDDKPAAGTCGGGKKAPSSDYPADAAKKESVTRR